MNGSGPFQDKPALAAESLTLSRGERVLVRDLSFAAGPGEYVEVRGGNGSGKTTLLRALAGFVRPRSGAVRFANVEEPALALHYLGHANGLKPGATVSAHLRYWCALLGGGSAAGDISTIASFGLIKQAELPARVLSQGQARRLALSRLDVAHRPIWLLDEPASGLDADGRAMFAAFVDAHREKGGVVIAAVHEPLGPAPSQTLTVGA